jgi:hypothetical protein
MDELKLDMEELLEPVQRMSEHLRGHYPTLRVGEPAVLAAQIVQGALLSECFKRLVSLEPKI